MPLMTAFRKYSSYVSQPREDAVFDVILNVLLLLEFFSQWLKQRWWINIIKQQVSEIPLGIDFPLLLKGVSQIGKKGFWLQSFTNIFPLLNLTSLNSGRAGGFSKREPFCHGSRTPETLFEGRESISMRSLWKSGTLSILTGLWGQPEGHTRKTPKG